MYCPPLTSIVWPARHPLRGQEQEGPGALVGRSEPVHGDRRAEALQQGRRRIALVEGRRDDTRRDCVHADAVLDQLLGQALGDRGDETLRASVQCSPGTATVARRHRGEVDDATALPLTPHVGHRRRAAHQYRAHVQVQHLVVELVGDLLDRRALHQPAGVVDQHVDAPELRHRLVDDAAAGGGIGDVAADEAAAGTQRLHLRQHLTGCVQAAVAVHSHRCTGLRKRQRRRGADAGARAGDQDHLVLEVVVHLSDSCPLGGCAEAGWLRQQGMPIRMVSEPMGGGRLA